MSEARDAATYTRKLTDCASLDELRALVSDFADLAVDAVPIVTKMTADDFTEFRRGLRQERKGRFAGVPWMERFGAILLPMPMIRISELAERFGAPFHITARRLKELRPDLFEPLPPAPAGSGKDE